MTRINCIPPLALHSKHLVAEYRELPRVFSLAGSSYHWGLHPDDLKRKKVYQLGKGHVLFFYDKLEFLRKRHGLLSLEMASRGYACNIDCSFAMCDLPDEWQHDWSPDAQAINRCLTRILQREKEMHIPWPDTMARMKRAGIIPS